MMLMYLIINLIDINKNKKLIFKKLYKLIIYKLIKIKYKNKYREINMEDI
jgi:hypothetical protein